MRAVFADGYAIVPLVCACNGRPFAYTALKGPAEAPVVVGYFEVKETDFWSGANAYREALYAALNDAGEKA